MKTLHSASRTHFPVVALVFVGLSLGLNPTSLKSAPHSGSDQYRYNEVRQLHSHNSYDARGFDSFGPAWKNNLEWQADKDGVRSFEFDLHKEQDPGIGAIDYPHSDWGIYHSIGIGSGGDHVGMLSEALAKLRRWHNSNPNHEVVTVWLQIGGLPREEGWEAGGHKPIDLDNNRLSKDMGDLIFKPIHLKRGQNNSLQSILQASRWPTLKSLRGKFIFVLHGDDSHLRGYLRDVRGYNDSPWEACCFVAPEIVTAPDARVWPDCVFFNLKLEHVSGTAPALQKMNLVSRAYKIDEKTEWSHCRENLVHHIATDHISRDQFEPKAVGQDGKPFEPFFPVVPPKADQPSLSGNTQLRPISGALVPNGSNPPPVVYGPKVNPAEDISGQWSSNIGLEYEITQKGRDFTWRELKTGQTAVGQWDGQKYTARWGKQASDTGTGSVTQRAGDGTPVQVTWSNGAIFSKAGRVTTNRPQLKPATTPPKQSLR